MELKDYKQTERYRVLDSTYKPYKTEDERKIMVGNIYEGSKRKSYNGEDIIIINGYFFNPSDVQLVTNVIKDGYEIGIGDKVISYKEYQNGFEWIVCDYFYEVGGWFVNCYRNDKEPFEFRWSFNTDEIKKVIPLKPLTPDPIKEAIRVLEEAGKIVDGKILID